MYQTNNVVSATTTNSGKSNNNVNAMNVNAKSVDVANVEVMADNVVNGPVTAEDVVNVEVKADDVEVRSQKTWEQLMHTENVAAYMGIDDEVKNRITHECGRWSCEEMKKMAKKRNVKSYRILKPNGEETNSFVRANGTNLAVIEYVDGRESIYIKLYNEDADDLWWYLVEEKDLIGFYKEKEVDLTYIPSNNSIVANQIFDNARKVCGGVKGYEFILGSDKNGNKIRCDITMLDDNRKLLTIYDEWRMHNTAYCDYQWRAVYNENDVEVYADVAMDFIYRLINTEK